MEKTRDLFKKTGDTKGTFHTKMGTIENRNVRTLQKQKRWQEYTELYRKSLNDQDNHDGVFNSARVKHPRM